MTMSKNHFAATVDEYLDALPDDVRKMLRKVRETIKEAAPKAEEVISYQIPTYKYLGAVVHFAAFKNHCSFFGVSKSLLQKFEKELRLFKVSGTTIHFSVDNPLPAALVKKFVKERIKQNELLALAKKNKIISR
jgi:uncharacterized protein YdhG (YjbR/CyaY superfamily)